MSDALTSLMGCLRPREERDFPRVTGQRCPRASGPAQVTGPDSLWLCSAPINCVPRQGERQGERSMTGRRKSQRRTGRCSEWELQAEARSHRGRANTCLSGTNNCKTGARLPRPMEPGPGPGPCRTAWSRVPSASLASVIPSVTWEFKKAWHRHYPPTPTPGKWRSRHRAERGVGGTLPSVPGSKSGLSYHREASRSLSFHSRSVHKVV